MNLNIPFVNGTYIREYSSFLHTSHSLAFDLTAVTGGVLTVRAKKPGSSFFENIPDGTINLAAPHTISFFGMVGEYEFTLASIAGTATSIVITDTSA